MIAIKPYEKQKQELLKFSPGQARSLFINWNKIAEYLNFNLIEELEYLNVSEKSLIDYAFYKIYENIDNSLEDTEIIELENNFLLKLKKHWSLENILLRHINLKSNTDALNEWAINGAKNHAIFGITPKNGYGVNYFINNSGISFTIYEAFMIPYTELHYSQFDSLPEWNFEDLDEIDIIETYVFLEEYLGNSIIIELDNWNEKL